MNALPLTFKYDETNLTVDVEFGDGSIVRYFTLAPEFLDPRLGFSDLGPSLSFLNPLNPRRNRDFVSWADQRIHALHCSQAGATAGPWMCDCRRVVKSEVIREATTASGEPQTRPILAYQQSEGRH